jgi:hypothetical protein
MNSAHPVTGTGRGMTGRSITLAGGALGMTVCLCITAAAPVFAAPLLMNRQSAGTCVNAQDAIADTGTLTIGTENRTVDYLHCAGHPNRTRWKSTSATTPGRNLATAFAQNVPISCIQSMGKT